MVATKKPTKVQSTFLETLRKRGRRMISSMRRDVIDRMVEAGWITLHPGPPRAHDRSRETVWLLAEITEAGRATLPEEPKHAQ